jgi:hypothetical protein
MMICGKSNLQEARLEKEENKSCRAFDRLMPGASAKLERKTEERKAGAERIMRA